MFDLEAFKRWDRQVDHGNDEIVEGAIAEIERLNDLLLDVLPTIDAGIEALAVLSKYDQIAPLEGIRREIAKNNRHNEEPETDG